MGEDAGIFEGDEGLDLLVNNNMIKIHEPDIESGFYSEISYISL